MRVLVTGATGFVGRQLLADLENTSHEVYALVRKESKTLKCKQIVRNDITKVSDWPEILRGVNAVVHLAARVHQMNDHGLDLDRLYEEVNLDPLGPMIEACKAEGVSKFVFMSSIKVMGEGTSEGQVLSEDDPNCPEDSYANSKDKAEKLLFKRVKGSNLDLAILRPPLIYGPGVKANFEKLLKLVQKVPVLPFGSFTNRRSMVFVGNLTAAIIELLETNRSYCGCYIMTDDEPVDFSELLKQMAIALNRRLILIKIPASFFKFFLSLIGKGHIYQRLGGNFHASNKLFKNHFDWSPPYSFQEAMRKTALPLLEESGR